MIPSDRAFNSVSISIRTDLSKSIHRCIPFVTSVAVGGILVEKLIRLVVLSTDKALFNFVNVTFIYQSIALFKSYKVVIFHPDGAESINII